MHLITDEYFVDSVLAEAESARRRFPHDNLNLAALTEEVGELAQAILDLRSGKHHSWKRVWEEAVQVASMAMRVATEGDASIAKPNHVNTRGME